jgi:hypothetical protein
MKTLRDTELSHIIEQMEERNLIAIENENVSYKTPISSG